MVADSFCYHAFQPLLLWLQNMILVAVVVNIAVAVAVDSAAVAVDSVAAVAAVAAAVVAVGATLLLLRFCCRWLSWWIDCWCSSQVCA